MFRRETLAVVAVQIFATFQLDLRLRRQQSLDKQPSLTIGDHPLRTATFRPLHGLEQPGLP